MNLWTHSTALAVGTTAGVLAERKLRAEMPSPAEQKKALEDAEPGTRVEPSYADITGKIAPLLLTLSASIGAGVLQVNATGASPGGVTAALLAGGAVAGGSAVGALNGNGNAEEVLTTFAVLSTFGTAGFVIGRYGSSVGASLAGTALFGAGMGMVVPWGVKKFATEFTQGPEKPKKA